MNLRPIALAICAPLTAVAAQDTVRIAPVVVTATRVPVSQNTLPVAVTVITAEELQLRGIATVGDALATLTSANVVQSGSAGATTALFLRGGESKYVKVLVDGVPANDPGGAYDFASLTTDNVERIEIVRGPASVVHGADAVTGVVHVITRRGRGSARGSVEVRAGMAPRQPIAGSRSPGSTNAYDVRGDLAGSLAGGAYSIALARHRSAGLYELNNDHHNNVLSGRFEFSPTESTELRVALRYTDFRFHYPTNGNGDVVDSNAHRVEDRTVLGVEVERRFSALLRGVLALSSSVADGGTTDPMDAPGGSSFESIDRTRRRGAELRLHYLPGAATAVTVGARIEQQDQRSQMQSQSSFGPFTDSFTAARRNVGAYAELVASPAARLTTTLGARLDANEAFGEFGTGRIGASWTPRTGTRLRATAGTAFREPSFFENYASGFVSGNPNLEPERTATIDGGLDQELVRGRVLVSLTGFVQRFTNMIDYESSGTACGYSYCNVAEARADGIEAEAGGRITGAVWGSVGATFLRTRVEEPGFDSAAGGLYRRGQVLLRRPARKYAADLSYRGAGPLTGAVRVQHVGTRDDRDFSGFPPAPVTLPGFTRVDLAAEYAVARSTRNPAAFTLRVENLFDDVYQNAFNFLAPRRTVSLGARVVF